MHEHFVYNIEIDLMTIEIAAFLFQHPTNLIPAGDYASFFFISDLFIFSSFTVFVCMFYTSICGFFDVEITYFSHH